MCNFLLVTSVSVDIGRVRHAEEHNVLFGSTPLSSSRVLSGHDFGFVGPSYFELV